MTPTDTRLGKRLADLYRALPAARRRQVVATAILMLVGAFAEIVSIGSLIPFLTAITNPSMLAELPIAGPLLAKLGAGRDPIAVAAILFISLIVFAGIIRLWLVWSSQRLAFDIGYDLSVVAFANIIDQPYDYYARTNSSVLIGRFEKANNLAYSVLFGGIQAVVSTILAAMLLIFMAVLSPTIALGAGGILILAYVLISVAVRERLKRNGVIYSSSWNARIETVQVSIGGVRDIILDRSQSVFAEEYRANAARLRTAQSVNAFIGNAPKIVIESVAIIVVAVVAWFVSSDTGGVVAAIPVLGGLALAAQRLLPLIQAAYVGWTTFNGNASFLAEVADLVGMQRVADPVIGDYPPFSDRLTFDKVSFAYPNGEMVLHDIDFAIAKGEHIGIAGTTGAGKSTLMDILLGLHRPTRGKVLIDGAELSTDRRAWWQSQIAHVPQHIFLADDSVARNIAFGVPEGEIDMDRVERSAEMAGIDAFVRTLPEGYGTFCGERGARLSGGQRQRLGIARALYKRAKVLVLDEATSALDMTTERGVMESIDALSKEITVIMIAHRLESLRRCDRILWLEHGRLERIVDSVDGLNR